MVWCCRNFMQTYDIVLRVKSLPLWVGRLKFSRYSIRLRNWLIFFLNHGMGGQLRWCFLHSLLTLTSHSYKVRFSGGRFCLVSEISIASMESQWIPKLPEPPHHTYASGWQIFVMELSPYWKIFFHSFGDNFFQRCSKHGVDFILLLKTHLSMLDFVPVSHIQLPEKVEIDTTLLL